MNTYFVKPAGLRWSVRKETDSSWSANAFNDCEAAVAYGEVLAKSNRPSQLQIFSSLDELVETRVYAALKGD